MIAIPLHESRVAPVLDWCSTILLIPKRAAESWQDGERLTVRSNVFDLLRLLQSMDVSPVICGALSPHALCYGQHLGLEFICGISGAVAEVVEAYRAGELDQPRFRLPGCRCQRPLGSAARPLGLQQGKGRGHSGAGLKRGGRRGGTGSEAVCICPQCGREVPHQRGLPCTKLACQECGVLLIRKWPTA